jgi:DNA-binding transcriptional regulator YhcF (GntR family)
MAAIEIVLNEQTDLPVREQLIAQLQMKILAGALSSGQRLPSVRALSRCLRVHPATVLGAYRQLQADGHVQIRPGSGVYVRGERPRCVEEASSPEEMVRICFQSALRRGFDGIEMLGAMEKWLSLARPNRLLVVDPRADTARLLVHELAPHVCVRVESLTLSEIQDDPTRAHGAMVTCLPYYLDALWDLLPDSCIEPINVQLPEADRAKARRLPPGSLIVVVASAAAILPFAKVFLRNVCSPEVLVEAKELAAARDWRALIRGADMVLADAVSFPSVRGIDGSRVSEFRIVSSETINRLSRRAIGLCGSMLRVRSHNR